MNEAVMNVGVVVFSSSFDVAFVALLKQSEGYTVGQRVLLCSSGEKILSPHVSFTKD